MGVVGYYTVFHVVCFGIYIVNCSRDLALNKTATQSSKFENYDASRAVDGFLDTQLESGHCSHTGAGNTKAWWKVDLGQVYRIQMINITYRHYDARRLQGYSLYVTNNTDMTRPSGAISAHDGYLCYHDNGHGLPTFIQTRQCHVQGRYVVFYNSRSYGEAYIELCEVQVYGCPVRQFGYNCSSTCHCATGGCDPDTGQCDVKGCQTGWMGLSCSLRCHCGGDGACNIDTGVCQDGRQCQSGWSGGSCFVGPRDLAHGKTARQSSTNGQFVAAKAVDGVITKDVVPHGSCSHTDPEGNYPEAWWEVDLGTVQQIRKINIVYRQQYVWRMSGFYLYVSNSSISNTNIPIVLNDSHLCYHDHGPGLPSYLQSLSCPVSGRYVIFYNKRPADYEPRNLKNYNKTTAVIELCEVQVLGECQAGRKGISCEQACTNQTFGRDCTQTCHCASSECDQENGTCQVSGCKEGYKGRTCSQACTNHTFGRNCNQTCHCANSDCDKSTGVCVVPECTEGWKGKRCSQVCTNHTFGRDCNQTCHCANSDCDGRTGECKVAGCTEGWKGQTCSQACTNHTFGRNCNQTCHCANSDCDKRTGVCKVSGCMDGWEGRTCSQGCTNHTFGRDCNQTCHCAYSDCDGRTGECKVAGCTEGWKGQTCSQACTNHTFGRNCNQTCHCANSDCNRRTGVCKVPGCMDGWEGRTCSQGCTNHTFGRDCNQTCHCANSDCDGRTGECKAAGCTEGWKGQTCSQACTNHTFGRDCNQTCHCANSDCDRRNGVCKVPGCMDGWEGRTCSQGCTNHTFGRDCTQTCYCANSDCDGRTGVCKVPGCTVGWNGKACSQECQTGYFGPNCTEKCHCQSPGCNHINGTCYNVGCEAGWSGQACDQPCTNHTFGQDCNQTCHCANSDCDGDTGNCKQFGCDAGWIGKSCSTLHDTQTSDESFNGNGAQIGGIVGAVVAVLLVIVISFIVVRKRRARGSASSKYATPNKSSKATENVYINVANVESTKDEIPPEVKITETDVDEDEVIYVNGPNDTDVRGETKLLMSELKEIVTAKKENEMYEVEFKSLPHGLKYPYKASNLPKNIPLNRFKTTFPYDHSRVVLKKEKANSTDYINANFIDGVQNEKTYIATQGPKTNTLEDFWRMIWQNKCGKIVMLANLMELGKIKCITYWAAKESDEEPLELNLFQVKLQEETAYAFYTIRTISVKNKQTNTTRRITQYHFTKWPDHGVPEPFELLQFYKRIKNGRTEHRGPLVVHCSAGIGRTGSYIGLDALLLDGKNSQDIDVFAYVEKMRKGRMNMIQTAKQYEMLHFVLLEGLKVVTTSMSKTDFCRTITDMMEDDVPAQQFAVLDAERPEYKPIEYEAALKNKSKNRNPSILAVDNYKVRLMSTQSGYINAVNIPGYKTAFGYILTQHPLDSTTTDFLSLVTQERADTVVSIGPLQTKPSWPTNKGSRGKFGNFVVSTVKCDNRSVGSEQVEERQITIENKELGINTKITLLETPSWGQSLPDSSFMLEMIQLIQRRRGIDTPSVIITCNDGATECGLLCAMCNVMERLEIDGDIDIMAAVRQLQIRRPQCLPSESQYVFCYQLVKEYLEADTVYANV